LEEKSKVSKFPKTQKSYQALKVSHAKLKTSLRYESHFFII